MLTGGIGSGKSTVTKYFAKLGTPIIDADEITHELSKQGQSGYLAIVAAFGNEILKPDKSLDRPKLRHIIFNDKAKKQQLEACLHPLVRHEIKQQLASLNAPYCIISIPLLYKRDQFDFTDRILVIDAPEALQIKRGTHRDNCSTDDIKKNNTNPMLT